MLGKRNNRYLEVLQGCLFTKIICTAANRGDLSVKDGGVGEIVIGAGVDGVSQPMCQALSKGMPQFVSQGLFNIVGRQVAVGVVEQMHTMIHHWMLVHHAGDHYVMAEVSHAERVWVSQVTHAVTVAVAHCMSMTNTMALQGNMFCCVTEANGVTHSMTVAYTKTVHSGLAHSMAMSDGMAVHRGFADSMPVRHSLSYAMIVAYSEHWDMTCSTYQVACIMAVAQQTVAQPVTQTKATLEFFPGLRCGLCSRLRRRTGRSVPLVEEVDWGVRVGAVRVNEVTVSHCVSHAQGVPKMSVTQPVSMVAVT